MVQCGASVSEKKRNMTDFTMNEFNGLGPGLGNLSRLSTAKTRSISAENPTREKDHGKGQIVRHLSYSSAS